MVLPTAAQGRSNPYPGGSAIPTVYDPLWQTYTDLSPQQIAAFQAFPQDLAKYAIFQRWVKEISQLSFTTSGSVTFPVVMDDRSQARLSTLRQSASAVINFLAADGNVYQIGLPDVINLQKAMFARVQNTYNTLNILLNGINAATPTVTLRSQIDSAYAGIA